MPPVRSSPRHPSRLLLLALLAALPAGEARAQAPAGVSPDIPPSVVRSGDRIRVRSWVADTLGGEYFVDERGRVVLPRVGVMQIAGLESGEARDSIEDRYARIIRGGHVEVTLLKRIGVHGEVQEPTLYWVDPTVTLREAVAMAGGLTDEGRDDRVILVRGAQRMEIETGEAAPLENVPLRSGDQIIIPRRSWASLNAPYLISTGVTLISVMAGFLLSGR